MNAKAIFYIVLVAAILGLGIHFLGKRRQVLDRAQQMNPEEFVETLPSGTAVRTELEIDEGLGEESSEAQPPAESEALEAPAEAPATTQEASP